MDEVRLKWALQGLALPGDQQDALFPGAVFRGQELTGEFETCYRAVKGEVTKAQLERLQAIDEWIGHMTDLKDASLWNDLGLRNRAEWNEMRSVARQALDAFGWKLGKPPEMV